MAIPRNTTRQRLLDAALALFVAQGITETTTKQIAERAEVNEVTLFRHFGNKQGLVLAVLEDAGFLGQLGAALGPTFQSVDDLPQALRAHARSSLQALERVPEGVRSLIGEAGQSPLENRRALGQGLRQANHQVAAHFAVLLGQHAWQANLSAEALTSLLHSLLLGHAVVELTSEEHGLWPDRETFLDQVVTLFLRGAATATGREEQRVAISPEPKTVPEESVVDLPAALVHRILQRAKKAGGQPYAIAYVLFGTGLSAAEVVTLQRHHYHDDQPQILQLSAQRQVPMNQWILGKRYGSIAKNPLTQWLKNRKDSQSALFVNDHGEALSLEALQHLWQALTVDLVTPRGTAPSLGQAQQTWCIDKLMKGMELETLQLLTGWDRAKLEQYAQRAREKSALEKALQLDR